MKTSLSSYGFIYKGIAHDYPIEEYLQSLLPVMDEVLIGVVESDDGTSEILQDYADKNSHLRLIPMPLPDHHSQVITLTNYLADQTKSEYSIRLECDEILYEDDGPRLRAYVDEAAEKGVNVGFIARENFFANYETVCEFDGIVSREKRLRKNNSYWRYSTTDCSLEDGLPYEGDTNIKIPHYTKVGDPYKKWQKEKYTQALYLPAYDYRLDVMKEELGEEFIDWFFIWNRWVEQGNTRPFIGTHPAVMLPRIKDHQDKGFEQFESRVEGLRKQKASEEQ